jgi:hypothetical protein
LGDENTIFFHSTSTIQHSKNAIMMLKNRDGIEILPHNEKAQLLWAAYKERLGISDYSHIYFDLNDWIQPVQALDDVQNPFSKEGIDIIIQNLPHGKSPRPDDFNTDFMKKCWRVISNDYYELCNELYDHNICTRSINGSYIVLVPKN